MASNVAPRIYYDDLRQWLDAARNLGEVKDVTGLSWQRDIGMVSEMAAHTANAPCFVFEDVPGTLPGSRVLLNFFDGKRKGMTLGFPTDMFTALFAVARTVGWVAQWNEMIADPEQKIGRPRQLYVGSTQRDYLPVDRR